jgi:hypothetical protein
MTEFFQRDVLETAGNHLVQFYDTDPASLVANVAAFIDEGLNAGDSIVVIASPEHSDAFLSALGSSRDPRDVRARRFVVLDAAATLDQFMVNGRPNWDRFDTVVGTIVRGLRRAKSGARVRAYGEMVGLLWAAGQTDAAVELEKFWNVLLGGEEFTLYCAYPVDGFAANFRAGHGHDVLCEHTHVITGAGDSMVMTSGEKYYSASA